MTKATRLKVYISHSRKFNFKHYLYAPIRASVILCEKYEIILPHEISDEPFLTKEFLRTCDAVVAEVSYPATGQGIELGWADFLGIPIICIFGKGVRPSGSLITLSEEFYEYDGTLDMSTKIDFALNKLAVELKVTAKTIVKTAKL